MVRLHDHPPMVFDQWKKYLPIVIIIFFSLFLFRDYFLKGYVPFPANLLVSTYEPWKSYPPKEYPNGPPNKAMGFDNVRIFYPIKKVATDVIRSLKPPLWNPYNFAGNVLLGSYQSAIFHPFSWLFLLLPSIDAWSVIIILQPVLTALSMYALLGVFGVSLSSRLVGALAFAFSGFFMTWWEESYMYSYSGMSLPLAILAIDTYIHTPANKWLALLAISLSWSVFSGMPQITLYVYGFVLIWILYRRRHFLPLFFALGMSLLVSAVQLLPSIEAYRLSTRISTDVKYIFDAFLLPLHQLVTLIAPDYYGNPATYNYFGKGFYHDRLIWFGVVPFILILTQLFRKNSRFPYGNFFKITFLITLSLVLSLPTTWFILYDLKLPLLSTMTPTRIMILVTFSGAILAAFGAEEYRKGFSKKILLGITLCLALAFGAAIAMPIYVHYLDNKNSSWIISVRNLVIPGISFFISLMILWVSNNTPRLRSIGLICFILILCGNTFLFAKKYLYFSERRFVFPDSPVLTALKRQSAYDRFWTYENGYVEKNFASYYSLFSPEGYDAYMIRRYGEFLTFSNSHGKSMEPNRSNALIQSTDHITDILVDSYRKKTLELLGVRYILQKLTPDKNEQKILADPIDLPRIWQDEKFAIHEYTNALPHAYLYADVTVSSNILPTLFDEKTNIHTTLFLEQSPPPIDIHATGSATISAYQPNMVSIQTQTSGAMMLFLSDTHYPGWNAYIDGINTPVYRANYAFRAVAVPKGNHTIVFKYEPLSWKLGIIGSVTGLIILLCLVRKQHS